MNATNDPDPQRRDDAADPDREESTPKSPGPPPNHPDRDNESADSPDDPPKSPGPPPGSVPGNR